MDALETIKAVVSDHDKLITRMLKAVEDSAKAGMGLEKVAPSVLNNESEANTRKMLNTTMRVLREQQEINVVMLSMLVMLCGSDDFMKWQARFATKTGSDLREVLRKMFEEKLRGRG